MEGAVFVNVKRHAQKKRTLNHPRALSGEEVDGKKTKWGESKSGKFNNLVEKIHSINLRIKKRSGLGLARNLSVRIKNRNVSLNTNHANAGGQKRKAQAKIF